MSVGPSTVTRRISLKLCDIFAYAQRDDRESERTRRRRRLHLLDCVPWNLSRKRNRYRDADALVISLGKSGRTWLRMLLHKALSLHFQIPFDVDRLERGTPDLPVLGYTHELAAHFRDDTWRQRLVGKSILPRTLTDGKRLIILHRDPRDIVVSSWFHKTRRSMKTNCSLEEFIRHPRWGITGIVWIMNRWRTRFDTHPRTFWLSYEDMHADVEDHLRLVLEFLDLTVDSRVTSEAVEFADFDRMKTREAQGDYASDKMRPGDPDDPDSFKVRRGKVEGYLDYFDEKSLAFLDKEVARLDTFYGYTGSDSRRR